MTAASLPFRGVCEKNLDKVEWLVELIPKQLDYSLSISTRDSWRGRAAPVNYHVFK